MQIIIPAEAFSLLRNDSENMLLTGSFPLTISALRFLGRP